LAFTKNCSDKNTDTGQSYLIPVGGAKVGIQNLSENVLLITLPEQPQRGDELEKVKRVLSEELNCNVVVDFSRVQMLTSETLCDLITLDRSLKEFGRLLVLCNVPSKIERIFIRNGMVYSKGLKTVFEFAKDELAALQRIRSESHLPI